MERAHWKFEAIGTDWEIFCTLSGDEKRLRQTVLDRIEQFDRNYSRFRSDSLVSAIARSAGEYKMPDDFAPLFEVYKKLYSLTDGVFTPCVGSVLEDLGYDAEYSLRPREARPLPLFDSLSFESPALRVREPVVLDFGAGGKGYLVDIVGNILCEHTTSFTINAGGDILHFGEKSLRVGLEDPYDTTKVVGVSTIENESICCSAGNRRRLQKGHHIINPRTRQSPEKIAAVWVIASTALEADALATALFLIEPEVLAPHFNFDWAILANDRSVRFSPRFAHAFFG